MQWFCLNYLEVVQAGACTTIPSRFLLRCMLRELALVRRMCQNGEAQQLRVGADVSLAEVADVIGVSPTTVYRWETGKSLPRVEHAASYWTVLQDLKRLPVAG